MKRRFIFVYNNWECTSINRPTLSLKKAHILKVWGYSMGLLQANPKLDSFPNYVVRV